VGLIAAVVVSCTVEETPTPSSDTGKDRDAVQTPDTGVPNDLTIPDPGTDNSKVGQDSQPEMTQDVSPDTQQDTQVEDKSCTLGGGECNEGDKCVPEGEADALVCRPAGEGQAGEPCGAGDADDCVAGAVCVPYDQTLSFCEVLCTSTSEDVPCPEAFQTCFPYFGPLGAVAGFCIGSDCEPPDQGCKEGERCTVLAATAFDCVPAGETPPGSDCSEDDCQAGSICMTIDGETLCRRFCEAASDCVTPDTHCIFTWQEFSDWGLCRPGCDPMTQDDCPEGQACYYMDPDVGSTDCWPEGSLAQGADCSSLTEFCEAGLDCILEPGSDPFEYYCRAWCDDEHPCDTGACQFTGAMPLMGVCL